MSSTTVLATSAVGDDSTVGTIAWISASNVTADDGNWSNGANLAVFLTGGPGGAHTTNYLRAAPASLAAIPADAIIDGIEVEYERAESNAGRDVVTSSIRLYKDGTGYVGDDKGDVVEWALNTGGTSDQEIEVVGGATDLWGTTWTRNEIVNDLEVGLSATWDSGGGVDGGIDYVQFTIYWHIEHNPTASESLELDASADIELEFNPTASESLGLTAAANIVGTVNPTASETLGFTSAADISGVLHHPTSTEGAGTLGLDSTAEIASEYRPTASKTLSLSSTASITFGDVAFKWSIEHLQASTSIGYPTAYVDIGTNTQPGGSFPPSGYYDRRLLELPRLEEVNLDSRSGVSGFQRVTLNVDNSDGLLNEVEIQDAFVRIFFVDESGNDYREFHGKVVDWTLSHTATINIEDIDVLAFSKTLPKRTLNDVVEAERDALSGGELTAFNNALVADDLGKPIPIIFGRNTKVPLLYLKADETSREYDYIIGEGVGLNSNNFEEVFTIYREDKALDVIQGDVAAATSTTLTLETEDRRPNQWYQYWYVEITAGTGVGQIRDITSYDSASYQITISSAWTTTPNTSSDYRLTEYKFEDGSQTSPYAGYAFVRFKKRLGTTNRTDDLFADVNGLQDEVNRVRAIESVLTNSGWGLGLTVGSTSFSTAASAMSTISTFTCEGAIINGTTAIDVLQKLLSFRDMVLSKDANIEITVDATKSSSFTFGLGDETGYNNILTQSPAINFIHPNQKVKDLKVRYRKNHKESDTYLHEFTRSVGTNGVDDTLDLPFIYDHPTADKALDYKRKRLASADRTLSIDVGQDGASASRGSRVTVLIPSIGLNSDWEVTGTNVVPAGRNTINLVPYSANPYTYVAFTSEGGTLPVDESFDIPPDYTSTNPDPVSSLNVTGSITTTEAGDRIGVLDISWTPPNDGNYQDAEVLVQKSSGGTYASRGFGEEDFRVEGLEISTYDVLVVSRNKFGLKGLAVESTSNSVGGATTAPSTPTAPTGDRSGRVVTFHATEPSSTSPIKNADWEVDFTSGGTDYSITETGFTISVTVSGTGSFSVRARLRVRNIFDQTSSYSSYSSAISNETWVQGHITDGEINGVARAYTAGSTTSSPLQSVTLTLRGGQPVDIDISFEMETTQSSATFFIVRDMTIVYSVSIPTSGFAEPGLYHVKYIDPSPSAGSTTYAVANVGFTPVSNRSMSVEERRR